MSGGLGWMRRFIQELRRRRVLRVAVVYATTAFIILQIGEIFVEPFNLPGWTLRLVTFILVLGFPLALGLAWVYNITEEGLLRTTSADSPSDEEFGEGESVTATAVRIGLLIVVLAGIGWVTWSTGLSSQSNDLQTETKERQASASETARAGEVTQPSPNLDPARVAVLYFDDNSRGDTLTAFADGFTEHLIHRLAQVEGLDVISRNGVEPFRDGSPPLDSIVRTLNAGSLIEGSVKAVGDSIAVFVQLIDGESQSHLISEVLRRPAEEVFALQNEVAEEVSRLLRKRLGQEVQLESWRSGTDRPKAWKLVQRADRLREDAKRLHREGGNGTARGLLNQADSLLAEAESIDPDWNAPTVLRARLAAVRVEPYGDRWGKSEREAVRRGIERADTALNRDSTDAEARMIRGKLRFWLSRRVEDPELAQKLMNGAEQDLRMAVRRAPSLAKAMHTLSVLHLEGRGEFQKARYYAKRALEADAYLRIPAGTHHQLFYAALNEGKFEEASHWCQRGRKRYPDHVRFWNCELMLLATEGAKEPDVSRAWTLLSEIRKRANPENRKRFEAYSLPKIAAVLARSGRPDSARAVLERSREQRRKDETYPLSPYYQSYAYLLLGEEERAVERLASFLERSPHYREVLANDIWFESLHGHPRFNTLISGR